MSRDYWVYLGPYALCEFEYRTVTHSLEDRACPRGHKVIPDVQYCPECGLKITWKEEEKIKTVSWIETIEKVHSQLRPVGLHSQLRPVGLCCGPFPGKMQHAWIPNVGYGLERDTRFDPHCEIVQQGVDCEMVEDELRLFRDAFAERISYLKSVYKRCTVEWGLLMYAS